MPVIMNPHHYSHQNKSDRTAPQRVCLSFGLALLFIGIAGIIVPSLLRMHLGMTHNFLNLVSGALAVLCGYSGPKRAYNFCLGFGAFYGLLGILGFLIGEPGYPATGYREADQNLFKVIPNYFEFGTMDHVAHMVISAFLLFTAYTFRKDRSSFGIDKRHL